MSAVFTKYLALQITTTGSRESGSSVLTVSPQSKQSVPPGHVFLKVCAVPLRSTSCAKADPDPTTMRQASPDVSQRGEKQLESPTEVDQDPGIIGRTFFGGLARRPRPESSAFWSGQNRPRPATWCAAQFGLATSSSLSSAKRPLATAGALGGIAPGEDSRWIATPRFCVP